MKLISLILVLVTGGMLFIAALDMPDWGDPNSPASLHVSPHYITKTMEETSVPNIVTSVLADYRGFDTMFETIVIFCAGIAIMLLLRSRDNVIAKSEMPLPLYIRKDLIVQCTCRVLLPIIQLFAFYVVAHGHHSPGGGFQGGVMLGASIILLAISFGLKQSVGIFTEKVVLLFANTGVIIYVGVGTVCVLLGRNMLDYGAWSKLIGLSEVTCRSLGMLAVEIGVAMTVMSIMFAIYAHLSSRGELRRGL